MWVSLPHSSPSRRSRRNQPGSWRKARQNEKGKNGTNSMYITKAEMWNGNGVDLRHGGAGHLAGENGDLLSFSTTPIFTGAAHNRSKSSSLSLYFRTFLRILELSVQVIKSSRFLWRGLAQKKEEAVSHNNNNKTCPTPEDESRVG